MDNDGVATHQTEVWTEAAGAEEAEGLDEIAGEDEQWDSPLTGFICALLPPLVDDGALLVEEDLLEVPIFPLLQFDVETERGQADLFSRNR